MSNPDRVDPELRTPLEAFPTFDYSAENLAFIRENAPTLPEPEGDGVTVEHRAIPGPEGAPDVRVLVFRKESATADKLPALLYIHGGGYVIGSPESMTRRPRLFAAEIDSVVFSTSYRLAPETKFPDSVEDIYATLCWMHDNADALGIDPERIAIYGESAGGGHAAALTLLARERGGPRICFQLLVYPMLDDRHPKDNPASGHFLWTRESDKFAWTSLLGVPAGSEIVPRRSVPARVEDLSGLPPAFICTGELDLFVDEDIVYANRLSHAGVPTGLYVAPGAYHGFDHFVPEAKVSQQFIAAMLFALKAAFGVT
jgi:triacylglycerol lipase